MNRRKPLNEKHHNLGSSLNITSVIQIKQSEMGAEFNTDLKY